MIAITIRPTIARTRLRRVCSDSARFSTTGTLDNGGVLHDCAEVRVGAGSNPAHPTTKEKLRSFPPRYFPARSA